MTGEEIRNEFALQNALRDTFWTYGMRLLPERESDALAHLRSLGCTASVASGYLVVEQQGVQMVLSQMCETVRKARPLWFVSDPRFDAISSREDFRGTPREIASAKAKWLQEHSLSEWESLPKTREEAERRTAVPDANMDRKTYLSLPFKERVKLCALGPDVIGKIMARTK